MWLGLYFNDGYCLTVTHTHESSRQLAYSREAVDDLALGDDRIIHVSRDAIISIIIAFGVEISNA